MPIGYRKNRLIPALVGGGRPSPRMAPRVPVGKATAVETHRTMRIPAVPLVATGSGDRIELPGGRGDQLMIGAAGTVPGA